MSGTESIHSEIFKLRCFTDIYCLSKRSNVLVKEFLDLDEGNIDAVAPASDILSLAFFSAPDDKYSCKPDFFYFP